VGKPKVMFVCVHNSARSQMAAAWMNALYGDRFEAKSAGLERGTLNPLAVETMAEAGVDISGNQTRSVYEFIKTGELFAWVITVCDAASAERCPIFPGAAKRLHWSFPDPAQLTGTPEEKRAAMRKIRDEIKDQVCNWGASLTAGGS